MKTGVITLAAFLAAMACAAGDTDTHKKLKSIFIRHVVFKNTDLNSVVRYLGQESRKLDYSGKGVNFAVRGNASKQKKITLELSNIPLGEVVRYVCLLGGLDYKIERNAVVIGPKGSLGGAMSRQTFHLPKHVLDSLDKKYPKGKKKDDGWKGILDGDDLFEK